MEVYSRVDPLVHPSMVLTTRVTLPLIHPLRVITTVMESPSTTEGEVEGGRRRENMVSSSMMVTTDVVLSEERRGEVGVPAVGGEDTVRREVLNVAVW